MLSLNDQHDYIFENETTDRFCQNTKNLMFNCKQLEENIFLKL